LTNAKKRKNPRREERVAFLSSKKEKGGKWKKTARRWARCKVGNLTTSGGVHDSVPNSFANVTEVAR